MAYTWTAYGRGWTLSHPPASWLSERVEPRTVGDITSEILLVFRPSDRDDFLAALEEDETLDVDVLGAMLTSIRTLLYPMPWGTVLALWDKYVVNEPLLHGRLIAQGNPKGVRDLNAYDAACLALTLYDESWSGLPGWTYNEKGRDDLYTQLGIGKHQVGDTQVEALAALSREIGMKEGQTMARPSRRPSEANE